MRLNAIWGLEVKDPVKDIHKACINQEDADDTFVVTNYFKKALAQKPLEMSDLDMMISLF